MKRGYNYIGKSVCQGCGKPGYESVRHTEQSLCYTCRDLLNYGKACKEQEVLENHVFVFIHFHAFYDGQVNDIVHQLFNAVHNEHVTRGKQENLHSYKGSNGKQYKIPERFYEPLKNFIEMFSKRFNIINDEYNNIPNKVNQRIALERTRIYNEGIAEGRKLLFGLNNGSLSLIDFEKEQIYYSGK